ncbi:hypothetical protein [Microbacterium atlanticum]|uniref:hypothetical protein n=1 Tax=Microbacterium atlanticum TaxID=2782168 RepID=UPI0018881DB3|nr:hypothetical protein [Microbacterium atlanticum]
MSAALQTALPSYRVAAAELPESVRLTDDPAGAVVAVSGERWTDAAARAIGAGAAAVVVSRPRVAAAEALAELGRSGVPIVLERALLRADAVQALRRALDGAEPFPGAVVECHAPAVSLPDAMRDAVGWARVFVGEMGVPSPASGVSEAGRGLALLEGAGGVAVSLVAAASPGAPPLGRIRVTGLGPTRVEYDGDEHRQCIEVRDGAGHRQAPRLFESPARVALRRAVAAVADGAAPRDVDDFARDDALSSAVVARGLS